MLWSKYLTFLVIILFQVNIIGSKRCQSTRRVTTYTRCSSCVNLNLCPSGTRWISEGDSCRFNAHLPWRPNQIWGCKHRCERLVTSWICCPGYWGQSCLPCPGIKSNKSACNGNGRCRDGVRGNGTCRCSVVFEGFACEKCVNKQKFGDKCQKNCTCLNGTCSSGVSGDGACQPYSCHRGYHGRNCETFEQSCSKSCVKNSHCVLLDTNQTVCRCNPGYTGNGTHCEEINPCKQLSGPCSPNAVCTHTGPGLHTCSCKQHFTGDGFVCRAIDYCQFNNGNCSRSNAGCKFDGPGKIKCVCLPGYENYKSNSGCSMIDLCKSSPSPCQGINTECFMAQPNVSSCRCKQGYLGNGTVCLIGNIIEQIFSLNKKGPWRGKLQHIVNVIQAHYSALYRALEGGGPFTLFVPLDSGVERNLTKKQRDMVINDEETVRHLSLVHSVAVALNTTQLMTSGGNVTTLKGVDGLVSNYDGKSSNLFFQLHGSKVKAKLVYSNVIASNGILHLLDHLVWKPDLNNIVNTSVMTLWEIVAQNPKLAMLKDYIQVAGIRAELDATSSTEMTFIAPADEAFASLDANAIEFLKSPMGIVKLKSILRHHMFGKKIQIIELIQKRIVRTQAPALVTVALQDRGAVVLGGKSKLIQTDISAQNGVLHISNGLLIPSFVQPIVKRVCDKSGTNKIWTSCRACHFARCPSGMAPTGRKRYCRFFVYRRCHLECVPIVRACCPSFYGSSCLPCPGPLGNPCFGNGNCSDSKTGTGLCHCKPNFSGTACELCQKRINFGPSCDKVCSCRHGTCNNGPTGNGSCIPGSCQTGYYGQNCDLTYKNCYWLTKLKCHIHAQCLMVGSTERCVCGRGYEGDGQSCYEIDPCQMPSRGGCGENSVCIKTAPGQNKCACTPGWTGDGVACIPINYCTSHHGYCDKNAVCTFLGPGQSVCKCGPGYKGDGKSCTEVNNCLVNNGNCSPFASCTKTGPGQHICKCRFNHIGDGYTCVASLAVIMNNLKDIRMIYQLILKSRMFHIFASNDSQLTVFLPSDTAMKGLDNSTRVLLNTRSNLASFLSLSMAGGLYPLTKLRNLAKIPSIVDNYDIQISHNSTGVFIDNEAKIVKPNITASNGILHVVDKVVLLTSLVKPEKQKTVVEALCNNTDLSKMCHFIKKFKLDAPLSDNTKFFTIFAPNDSVWHDLSLKEYNHITVRDIQYHITDHFVEPSASHDAQPLSTMLGQYYVVTIKQQNNNTVVNGIPATWYSSGNSWVIYKIPKILKPTRNYCFESNKFWTNKFCVPCRYAILCPPGYRYVGKRRCLRHFRPMSSIFPLCRVICVKQDKVKDCCRGFYGRYCDACPGENGNPCSGNGQCSDLNNGTGVCSCKNNFAGTACERCSEGYFGKDCKPCTCSNNALCDMKTGLCICPKNLKGAKCTLNATRTPCGPNNATCHQHASCEGQKCKCDNGFKGNGTSCEPKYLCYTNNGGCSPFAICAQSGLNLSCECKKNYKGDGYYCQGINPCSQSSCHINAQCVYLQPGRPHCICKPGYIGNGITECRFVNPCHGYNTPCDVNALCSYNSTNASVECICRTGFLGNGLTCIGSLMEMLQSDQSLTEFYSRLQASDVRDLLSPQNVFTVFAPNNDAFNSLRRRKRRSVHFEAADMKYHIVSCVAMTDADLDIGNSFLSVAGDLLNITSPNVINDKINIVSVIHAINGTIIIIDDVIKPANIEIQTRNMTFYDALVKRGYNKLASIIRRFKMRDLVDNPYFGPYTMLWPTDEALSSLPEDIERHVTEEQYIDIVRAVLKYHIISKTRMTTTDILAHRGGLSRRTNQGASVYMSCKGSKGDIVVNDRAMIVERDMEFAEGIAFGISELLAPPGLFGRCDEITYKHLYYPCDVCVGVGKCPANSYLQEVKTNSSCFLYNTYNGCSFKCLQRITKPKCCRNFYGPDCQECPTGAANPCSGRGRCDDGTAGSGNCSCPHPYFGTACENCVNEDLTCGIVPKTCAGRSNPCSVFATCVPRRTELCKCISGFQGDGFYCQEIDKCQQNNGGCSVHAVCIYRGPGYVRCRCRHGFIGNGTICSALPPSNPCSTDNGNCHAHAACREDKDGRALCTCWPGFVGNGIYCSGSLMQVINDVEELSEFAKAIKKLVHGVEGSRLIRGLSSEMVFTVFAPINYGFTTQKMTIHDVMNHIVEGNVVFHAGTKQTLMTLANTKLTVEMSKNSVVRVNNIAKIIGEYEATNGIIHIMDHIIPYVKTPPTQTPSTKGPKKTVPTDIKAKHGSKEDKGNRSKIIGGVVGGMILIVIIIIVVVYLKKRRRLPVVRYKKSFGTNILFESEAYNEDDADNDDYEQQVLQHPSSSSEGDGKTTYLTNPNYDEARNDADDEIEMLETGSTVPLTAHDSVTFG